MKIGIEAQRIFRQKKHGMDFVALELINNLPADSDHEFFVFVNAKTEEIDARGFQHVTIVNHKAAYPIWEQLWLPKMAEKLELDVLHCTANTFPISCKVPVVLTLHDIIFMENNPFFVRDFTMYQRFGNAYRRFLVTHFMKRVKQIATVSKFEQNNIATGLRPSHQAHVIYNGVSNHFNAEILSTNKKQELISSYKLPSNFLLFLGNTDPKKNTANTLKAFADFSKNNADAFLVVGDLKAAFINQCLPGQTYQQVREKIVAVGYINNQDLPGLIKLSKGLIYTSLRESFGIPLVEGMACGTPVLSSTTSSMPEIAQDAALLVDPTSISAMANGMDKIWNDEQIREKYFREGPARSKSFSWKKMAQEYITFYEKAAQ